MCAMIHGPRALGKVPPQLFFAWAKLIVSAETGPQPPPGPIASAFGIRRCYTLGAVRQVCRIAAPYPFYGRFF